MTGNNICFTGVEAYAVIMLHTMLLVCIYRLAVRRNSRLLLVAAILLSGVTVGMRFNLGLDTANYVDWVVRLGEASSFQQAQLWSNQELTFIALCHFTYKIFGTYRVLFLVYSILTAAFFLTGLWNFRNKINVTPALLYYIIFFQWNDMCNIMRQTLAMSIVFWWFKYIYSKERKKYVIVVAIASLFHFSAIATVVLMFYGIKESKIGVVLREMNVFLALLLAFGPRLTVFIINQISSRYAYRITSKFGVGFIVNIVVLITMLYANNERKTQNPKLYYMIREITILASIFVISDYTIGEGARFREYFNTIYMLTLGYMCKFSSLVKIFRTKKTNLGTIIAYGWPLIYLILLCGTFARGGNFAFSLSIMN